MTPYKVVYGRDPPPLLPASYEDTSTPDLLLQLQERDQLLHQLKGNLERAQHRMKNFADRNRTDVQFQIGDFVLVKLQPYRQHSVRLQKHHKLGLRYFGPFPVIEKIGTVAYKVQLPSEARIHPVFHVSLLKHYHGDHTRSYFPLPLLTIPEGPVLSPVEVLGVRSQQVGSRSMVQLLINWGPIAPPSWELLEDIRQIYPTFDLGDKVALYGGGNVMHGDVTHVEEVQTNYTGKDDVEAKRNGTSHSHAETVTRSAPIPEEPRRSSRERRPTWKRREQGI